MKSLFIGGYHDGELIENDGRENWQLPVPTSEGGYKVECYRRVTLADKAERWFVYVQDGFDKRKVVGRWLAYTSANTTGEAALPARKDA